MGIDVSPLVSVVIPAFNAASTLPACLDALAHQAYPAADYEVIVVDDGSGDDTAAVARRCGATRVVLGSHGGPGQARNAGAEVAQGQILLFVDADCEPLPNWIAEMVRPLDDPQVVAVKGSYRTRQGSPVARLAQCEFEERYELLARVPSTDFVDSHSAAFRTAVFRAAGGFDPSLRQNEDVELSYRLATSGHRLVFNRRAQVYHRHPATWRAYLRVKVQRGYWRMLVYRRYPGKALRDSYTPQALKLQVGLAYAACGLGGLALLSPRRTQGAALGAVACSAGLVLSGWPFVRLVARRDRAIAPWAPFFILARAAAFALGVAGGSLAALFRPGSRLK